MAFFGGVKAGEEVFAAAVLLPEIVDGADDLIQTLTCAGDDLAGVLGRDMGTAQLNAQIQV